MSQLAATSPTGKLKPVAPPSAVAASLTTARILRTWWPLALSWLCMAFELPALSAAVARLPNPEIQLAAYGSIVFTIALIIESPVIMLLAASTALSQDWASYLKVRRAMMLMGVTLTLVHALVVFTPLYYVVVQGILGAPASIVEPGRIGLAIFLPWTWSIAYRRFHQGVLIRFGRSRAVGLGTFIRISTVVLVLAIGFHVGSLPGVAVAGMAVIAGVVMEAIYVHWAVQPVLRGELKDAPPAKETLTQRGFIAFYVPLVLTSLLNLLALPFVAAGLNRMPNVIPSLAAWPAIEGLLFMLQSAGIAYNEVVVALMDAPEAEAERSLRRFTIWLFAGSMTIGMLVALTPLAGIWFGRVIGLAPPLAALATAGLAIGWPLAGLTVLQSWSQGNLMHQRRTRGVGEAVALNLLTMTLILLWGIWQRQTTGLYVGVVATVAGALVQVGWLWWRKREGDGRKAVESVGVTFG